ncbi:hypothetical protein F5I97DRAFT_1567967 [Phlebopus sp. FC_14]|nr:hypothetical protein F5I97DRAFT_1567967 [Phlebopus sp. FC_14]
MAMNSHLHLTYFFSRGRREPMILLLADSGHPFTLEEFTLTSWNEMKNSGQVTPDRFPSSTLPTLRVSNIGGDSKGDLFLAESIVIISFLEEFLAPQGKLITRELPLEMRARMEMTKELSLHTSGRIMLMSGKPDWLALPNRNYMYHDIVLPYLRNTEHALAELSKAAKIVPEESDPLTALSVTVAAAINLITDLFPRLRSEVKKDGEFEHCWRVWDAAMRRPRIAAYWNENQIQGKNWTHTRFASAEWIAKEAKKYDADGGNSNL